MTFLGVNLFGLICAGGFDEFFKSYFAYTNWSETFVFIYYFLLVLAIPLDEKKSSVFLAFQQGALLAQIVVVLIFWTVLFPHLVHTDDKYKMYLMYYKHLGPFLGMKFIREKLAYF